MDNVKTTQDFIDEVLKDNPDTESPNLEYLHKPSSRLIKPLSFADMTLETPAPMEFVVYPFLPVQGIACIYAASGVGKTLFTLNLAYAIAGGGNFLKYSCPKPRKVLYVDGEMAYNQLHSRIMHIAEQQGELDFKDNLKFITPDKLSPHTVPMIDTPEGQQIYLEMVEENESDVIILDNFSMLSSFDENKAHEFKPIQNFMIKLKSSGRSVIAIHHAGKNKRDYRGTSRMLDCVNTAISLQPNNDDEVTPENCHIKKFRIVYQKARDFGGKDGLPFEISLENNKWTYQSTDQTDMDRCIELHMLGMKQEPIARDIGCSQSKVAKLLAKARKLGLIRE